MRKSGLPPKESQYKELHLVSKKPSYFRKYFIIECGFVLLILYNFYFSISSYTSLPEKIPMHFNGAGDPDSWAPKTIMSVLISPLMSILMYLGLTIGGVLISKSRNPLKYINLPIPRNKIESLDDNKIEELREVVIKFFLFLKLAIIVMFTYIGYATIKVSLGTWKKLDPVGMMLDVVIIFIGAIWLTVQTYRIVNKKSS